MGSKDPEIDARQQGAAGQSADVSGLAGAEPANSNFKVGPDTRKQWVKINRQGGTIEVVEGAKTGGPLDRWAAETFVEGPWHALAWAVLPNESRPRDPN